MRKILITSVLLFLEVYPALAQVPSPQIPLTGTPGSAGNFPFIPNGTFPIPTDANYTVIYPNTSCIVCVITSSVSLTATRNLVEPGSSSAKMTFNITNSTSGGQSIQVIAASGSGVTIANGTSKWVYFNGTNYVEIDPPGSGTSLPTATAPGQIISSTAAGTAYGVQTNIFYSQPGDTIASIETECSSICAYIVSNPQTITLAADHTLSANVFVSYLSDGLWTVNGAHTLTFTNTPTSNASTQHFAGSATLAGFRGAVRPEWFGATAYALGSSAIATAAAGTNDAPKMAKAIAAIAGNGWVELGCAVYHFDTVAITTSNTGIIGDCPGYVVAPTGSVTTTIVSNAPSAGTSIVTAIGASSSVYLTNVTLQGFAVQSAVVPVSPAACVYGQYIDQFSVVNVNAGDCFYGLYTNFTPSSSHGGITGFGSFWGESVVAASSLPSGMAGIFQDSANNLGGSSLHINLGQAACQLVGSKATGILASGISVTDTYIAGFATAGCNIGIDLENTGTSGFVAQDVLLTGNVLNGCVTDCLKINGMQSTTDIAPHVYVTGGNLFSNAGAVGAFIENSTNISLTNVQIFGAGSGGAGQTDVLLNTVNGFQINDNDFADGALINISCISSTTGTIIGNKIKNSNNSTGATAIKNVGCTNVSEQGNVIAGNGGSNLLNGITYDAASSNAGPWSLNTIDSSTVTTPVTDAGTHNNDPTLNSSRMSQGSSAAFGVFKVDGTTITAASGVLSAVTGGGGTVTHSAGALTASDCVIGNGSADIKVDPNCSTDGAGNMTLTSVSTNGTTPGKFSAVAGTGSIPALTANSAGFAAPVTGGTAYLFKLPATITVGILHAATPATNDGVLESALTSSLIAIADFSATGTPSSTTFLRGDNTWATPSAVTPAYPQTVTGCVSGGILYGSLSTQVTCSPAGTAGQVVLWGGAGTAPGAQAIGTSGATLPLLNTANTWSGTQTHAAAIFSSLSPGASTASLLFQAAPFSGGTGTTTFPLILASPGLGPTTWSTGGTYFGVSAQSAFAGNFLDFHVNGGASVAKLDASGNLTVASCTGCGGGGNTTSTSLTTNVIPRANGANSIIDSAFTDNGTTGGFARAGGFAPTHLISADLNTCPDTSGSGTAQVCSTVANITPVGGNTCVLYTTTTTNSGAGLTLNMDSFGVRSIAIPGASGWTTTLTAGIIPANKPLNICYDGTNWNVQQTGTAASGSGGPTIKTNTVNNTSQVILDFTTSTANATGLTVTPSNPSGGVEKEEITGTLNIASGGFGASTAAAFTVFGNETGSIAAPHFTGNPQVSNMTVNGSLGSSTYIGAGALGNFSILISGNNWNPATTTYNGLGAIDLSSGTSVTPGTTTVGISDFHVGGTWGQASTTYTGDWAGVRVDPTWGLGTSTVYNGSVLLAGVNISPTINLSTSSTKGYALFYGNATETSVSTSTNYGLWLGVGGTAKATIDSKGTALFTGTVTSALGNAAITSATGGTGVTSVTCATAACTVSRGSYTVVGGTATTGTIITLLWPTTTTAWVCSVDMNGGTGFLGIGHSVATATGMNVTSGLTVVGVTFIVDYNCVP